MIRAEACAKDFYSALDCAITKLDTRLRRAADRRRVHRGRHAPVSVAAATAGLPHRPAEPRRRRRRRTTVASASRRSTEHDDDQPWHIVREKEHPAEPMTVDDALFQMELVGHDFYLFHDKETGRPSVVYRRAGYDYGILSLESTALSGSPPAGVRHDPARQPSRRAPSRQHDPPASRANSTSSMRRPPLRRQPRRAGTPPA